jgi:flavin-dependent dehydrogenase
MAEVIIVGGGLGGLLTALQLARTGIAVTLFERKQYPFHRVCGEYISNETVPFLRSLGAYPDDLNPPVISELQLTSVNGRTAILPLDLGGFGVSRYALDAWLVQQVRAAGAIVHEQSEVTAIDFTGHGFDVAAGGKRWTADVVIAAHGKRSRLDVALKRSFLRKRSPYVGVKYHIRYDQPRARISLHNFENGYCGISQVESNTTNLCYLVHRDMVKKHHHIPELEKVVLHRNPHLKEIFTNAEFLFDRPEVINEISFATKGPLENHVLMGGDAAGMITPLCGNGMAMAIHASKLLAEEVGTFCRGGVSRAEMEKRYANRWNNLFAQRLWAGRQIQNLFGSEWASNLAVNLARFAPPVAQFLVRQTHGAPF